MTDRDANSRLGDVAQKWRDLAEQRRLYYVDLYESGRWKRYCSEEDMLLRLGDAARGAEAWAKIAPLPAAGNASTLQSGPLRRIPPLPPVAEPEAVPQRRTASAWRRPAA
jgi:uncharacterized repeat protein (TIGR03809 family)